MSANSIVVDGVTYVKAPDKGARAVVVVDRGWIFAGDVTEENGRIYLDNAVWVFKWDGIGFATMVAAPKTKGVDIRPIQSRVDIPRDSEVFRIPVAADWGR